MSRHKGSKAEATRALILEAATELFSELGVNEVSISRIMAEIGLTHGGFYKYFSSKEMLAAEVCDLTLSRARSSWEEHVAHARQTAENPYRYLISQYLSCAEKGSEVIVAFSHSTVGNCQQTVFSQSYREGLDVLLQTLLNVARETGAERTKAPVLLHFAAMLGTALLFRTCGSEPWVREIERSLLDQLG